jgi:hypothetical protein
MAGLLDEDLLDLLNNVTAGKDETLEPVVNVLPTTHTTPTTKKRARPACKTPKAKAPLLSYPSQPDLWENASGSFEPSDPFYRCPFYREFESQEKVSIKTKRRIEPEHLDEDVPCPVCEERVPGFVLLQSGACLNCSVQVYSHIQKLKVLPPSVLKYFLDKYLKQN